MNQNLFRPCGYVLVDCAPVKSASVSTEPGAWREISARTSSSSINISLAAQWLKSIT